IPRDRQILDADDLQLFDQVEEPDGADPAETGVADAIAVDLDVKQLAGGNNPSAIQAAYGSPAGYLQRNRRIARARLLDRAAGNSPGRLSIAVGDDETSERDAVARGTVDFVFHHENIFRRPGDLDAAMMLRQAEVQANKFGMIRVGIADEVLDNGI